MKNFIFFFVATLALMMPACSPQPVEVPASKIFVNIANTGQDKVEVYNIENDIYYEISGISDSLEIEVNDELVLNFVVGRVHSYVHLKAGENLSIDTISSEPILLGAGATQSKENEYLTSFRELLAAQAGPYTMRSMAKYGVDTFLLKIGEKYATVEALIGEIQNDATVSTGFQAAMSNRLMAIRNLDLLNYEGWHNYLNKEYPELPDNFYADLDALDFTDPTLMVFQEGRNLGNTWHAKDIDYEDYESDDEYFTAMIAGVNETYPSSLMRDYCNYKMTADQINFGSGIDGASAMIESFKASVTNSYLNTKLDQTIAPWLNLTAGSDAPNFVAVNRDGEQVQLSDLKGKRVYVDVWATWCGPCIREIPALKELETELHEENIEFVSVSIDKDEDKEKWLAFVAEKELKGVQLMASGAWQSDVATGYNVKGIPRFLLIDEAGKILSANAPRPSDPKTKGVLLE